MAKAHRGLTHWRRTRGGKFRGIGAGFTLQRPSKSEHPCVTLWGCLSHASSPCSKNLQKKHWSFFPNHLAQFLLPASWDIAMTQNQSVFLWCNVPWCRYLEWLKTAQQVSPCLWCSVNKAWTHQNSGAFTDTSKGSQVKLEDRGRGSGGHLHMQYLKRECNLWSSKTINKGHPKKTVLSKLFSHLMEISPAYQQFLSSTVFHYSCIHYS